LFLPAAIGAYPTGGEEFQPVLSACYQLVGVLRPMLSYRQSAGPKADGWENNSVAVPCTRPVRAVPAQDFEGDVEQITG